MIPNQLFPWASVLMKKVPPPHPPTYGSLLDAELAKGIQSLLLERRECSISPLGWTSQPLVHGPPLPRTLALHIKNWRKPREACMLFHGDTGSLAAGQTHLMTRQEWRTKRWSLFLRVREEERGCWQGSLHGAPGTTCADLQAHSGLPTYPGDTTVITKMVKTPALCFRSLLLMISETVQNQSYTCFFFLILGSRVNLENK